MREILFRGKATNRNPNEFYRTSYKNGDWVYGFLSDSKNYLGYAEMINTDGICGIDVDPETVGQSTGLTDKNGTKIFEGDIVKFGINQRLMYVHMNEETLTWELTDVGVSAYEVNHLINTFQLAEIQVESAYGEVFSEIVGNIHDNPELLKGGADNG